MTIASTSFASDSLAVRVTLGSATISVKCVSSVAGVQPTSHSADVVVDTGDIVVDDVDVIPKDTGNEGVVVGKDTFNEGNVEEAHGLSIGTKPFNASMMSHLCSS